MFGARLRPLIDPPLNRSSHWLAARGATATGFTLAGLMIGWGAALAAACQLWWIALLLVVLNRLCDGLDGAIARARGPSTFGGYLDIVADFGFDAAMPVGFGLADPANPLYALILVATFTITGISFLAFAAVAANHGLSTEAHGKKSFFYSTGLAEGSETIAVFLLMCLFPGAFPILASVYALLCVATVIQRSLLARQVFSR